MRTICGAVLAASLLIATQAHAAPLLSHNQPALDPLIQAAKVICDEAGNCYGGIGECPSPAGFMLATPISMDRMPDPATTVIRGIVIIGGPGTDLAQVLVEFAQLAAGCQSAGSQRSQVARNAPFSDFPTLMRELRVR